MRALPAGVNRVEQMHSGRRAVASRSMVQRAVAIATALNDDAKAGARAIPLSPTTR